MADLVNRGIPLAKTSLVKTSKFVPLMALRSITSKSRLGVYASSDTLYKGAVFGRDSLEVAEDLMNTNRLLVRRVILTLASLQGELSIDANEEEPGKIIHEYRRRTIDGRKINGDQLHIFETLSRRWGGDENELAYYGSVDATPQFIRDVGRYVHRYGEKILSERIILRSGNQISMKVATENAISWLCKHLETSKSGLVEFQRRTPEGILNQVWKDSDEFYIHADGKPVNHKAPIASIEVQALAYDALRTGATLFEGRAEQYLKLAQTLRDKTIHQLWLPDESYFALGIDFDNRHRPRIIKTRTANPAALLDSYFFYDLPEADRNTYVSAIVETIMGEDFLTDGGIRSRALSSYPLVAFWDYHGSFVSWPKETYDIAKGLRRQGFPSLARELENRLINIVLKNREYPEFIYVDLDGRVLLSAPTSRSHGDITIVNGPNKPENIQAWTVSAALAIINTRVANKLNKLKKPTPIYQAPWQRKLEKKILSSMPHMDRLLNPVKLKSHYPSYRYRLNPDSNT